MARNLSKKVTDAIRAGVGKKGAIAIAPVEAKDLWGTGRLAQSLKGMGVSAEDATAAFNALTDALGDKSRGVILTRPKGRGNDFTARLEAKDIHGGHVSISPTGIKTFEVYVNYTDRGILNPFQINDHVIMSGKEIDPVLHLTIVDRKIDYTDRALLILENRPPPRKPPSETEEENLDILYELSQ